MNSKKKNECIVPRFFVINLFINCKDKNLNDLIFANYVASVYNSFLIDSVIFFIKLNNN